MAVGNIKVDITIKWWAKPVVFVFVFLGMYPPRWVFSMSKPYYGESNGT
tara:strand:- start:342 stop:488 length:147 start_codon:yes stop_codon:yes gene_type:complete